MKSRELHNLGVPKGEPMQLAHAAVRSATAAGMDRKAVRLAVRNVAEHPESHVEDAWFGPLAKSLTAKADARAHYHERPQGAPWRQWGENLDPAAVRQLENACRLPVSVAGALMPDAHLGYGLPIGGVLAMDNAVAPYAVGVDIACRMKMTVLDLPVTALTGQRDRLAGVLQQETRFGVGAEFKQRRDDEVMDEDWSVSPITQRLKDKAWSQLGTSGSGNHFVEFGLLTLDKPDLGLAAGTYLALLSHSGSRGTGAEVAGYYSRRAMNRHPELPKELSHLAWLSLDTDEGREYWAAMSLMGRYAAANHRLIHSHIARHLGARVILDLENHHNFAWRETHFGREVVVHRKGATPASKGAIGIIPGSMATSAYVVRGLGEPSSLNSAAHGAGRVMSRKEAKRRFTWSEAKKLLADRGVELLSAGLDEVPMVYKDIEQVMAAQRDLVVPVARFEPKLVKMAPGGRAED